MNSKQLLLFLLVLIIGFTVISARGCPKRSKEPKIGSSNEWVGIAAPSSLTVTAFSYSEIRLSWQDNSNNEDGFAVERKEWLNGTWGEIDRIAPNNNSYTNTGLTSFIPYYYRVRAFNTVGDYSGYSNEASAITVRSEWQAIAAGEYYSIVLNTDGSIWGWGDNRYGQLDPSNYASYFTIPTLLNSDTDWSIIAAGFNHTLALKNNSVLWSWGSNDEGQLGLGDTELRTEPVPVGTDLDWSIIAGGIYHSIALKTIGTLWVWGNNSDGQLGLGSSDEIGVNRLTPNQVGTDSDWFVANTFGRHNIALKTNRTLWAWGWNSYSQLGDGTYDSRTTPRQIGTNSDWSLVSAGYVHTIALKTGGTLWQWGTDSYITTPTQIGTDSDWFIIKAGGTSEEQTNISYHNIALKSNDTLWTWGKNNFGQLGLGDNFDRTCPTQIGTDSNWVELSAGGYHSSVRKTNGSAQPPVGTLYVWGRNELYQLGLGDTINRNISCPLGSPAPPALLNLIIVSTSQINLSWLDNSFNENGFVIERKLMRTGTWEVIGSVTVNTTSYPDVFTTTFNSGSYYYYRLKSFNNSGDSPYSNEMFYNMGGNWSAIAVGNKHNIALKTDGTIWSWGYNEYGQLGLSDTIFRTIPIQVGTNSDWLMIASGGSHSISRKTNNTLWSWGSNDYGQLGLGDATNRNTPTSIGSDSDWLAVSGTNLSNIVAGNAHAIALKNNNSIWAWGWNYFGQLGLGDNGDGTERNTPTQVGTDNVWANITVGYYHSIGLKTDNSFWAWGFNMYGQLGLGTTNPLMINLPTPLENSSDWSTITGGSRHTIATKTDRTLWSWGSNNSNQLGREGNNIIPGQIGTDSDWSVTSAGEFFSLAFKTNRTIWGWGNNNYGQLGLGYIFVSVPTPTQIGTNLDWFMVVAGKEHTIGRKIDGTLWSWGYNEYGQLGLGDTINRNVPTLVGE